MNSKREILSREAILIKMVFLHSKLFRFIIVEEKKLTVK